jgi:hypothetical protein
MPYWDTWYPNEGYIVNDIHCFGNSVGFLCSRIWEQLSVAHDDMADMMSQAAAWLAQASLPTVTISNAFTGEVLARY